jgi:hypothetical protein
MTSHESQTLSVYRDASAAHLHPVYTLSGCELGEGDAEDAIRLLMAVTEGSGSQLRVGRPSIPLWEMWIGPC